MASEKLRQREVLKFYQAWLDSSIGFDSSPTATISRFHCDGSQLRVSKDKALIAFAQLGCLRLDVKRSVVTLISTDLQYILAEATRTLSLVSGDGDSEVQDQLWFGNAMLPRSQGVSGDALAPGTYTAMGINGSTYSAPALVIDDMTIDERYKDRPFAGQGVSFYCGVPILTEAGIPIGVYTMTDDKPRKGVKPDELRFMHDMAATVMRHLEVVSNEAARFRGETMVIGLGRFISGAPSLHDTSTATTTTTTAATSRNASPKLDSLESRPIRQFKGMTIKAAMPSTVRSFQRSIGTSPHKHATGQKSVDFSMETAENAPTKSEAQVSLPAQIPISDKIQQGEAVTLNRARTRSDADDKGPLATNSIFTRAANILQECVAADGVLFFDAVSTNFGKNTYVTDVAGSPAMGDSKNSKQNLDGQEGFHGTSSEDRDSNIYGYSGASEESDTGISHESEKRVCKVLGHAFDANSDSTSDVDLLNDIRLTERSLGRLVKMYPQGKLFTFSSDSGLAISDGEHLAEDPKSLNQDTGSRRTLASDGSTRIPRAIADELERLVPFAQRIVWLPLWDFSKQRWSAGLFLWSRRPDRLVAAQEDLVYLKAFANSIMVEVARLDAAIADTAKSTFIANISHELRTPLHGILGNLDILQETSLTEFQQSLVTAIEMCGRTLTDTIDHVLDYSKINQLTKYSRKRNKSAATLLPSLSQNMSLGNNITTNEENFDLAAIVEEAVEAAYASHTFQSSGRTRLSAASVGQRDNQSASPNPVVQVVINIDQQESWGVHSQPSAIRRVVTNLIGNALKYTDAGSIVVSLTSLRKIGKPMTDSQSSFVLTVKDTGRGMSADFVRNHAFTPFSQESQFSIGTGLGLSIVQQIVKTLGGNIELHSEQGIGTEIRVILHLKPCNKEDVFSPISPLMQSNSKKQRLFGLTMQVVNANSSEPSVTPNSSAPVIASVETTASSWYGLQVVHRDVLNQTHADIYMCMEVPSIEHIEQLSNYRAPLARIGIIVVVQSTLEKAAISQKLTEQASKSKIFLEVLSSPLGPQKLGHALRRYCEFRYTDTDDTPNTQAVHSMLPSSLHHMQTQLAGSHIEVHSPHLKHQTSKSLDISKSKADSVLGSNETSTVVRPRSGHDFEYTPMPGASTKRPASPSWNDNQPRPSAIMPRSISAPTSASIDKRTLAESSLKVLLVDDNEINLNILKTCMKRAQITFDFAKDGLEASNTFQHAYNTKMPFTHVLMDISMPVMDGIQSTREIRNFERKHLNLSRTSSRTDPAPNVYVEPLSQTISMPEIKDQELIPKTIVIALSGVASENTQLEMLEAGADMFLPKPVKLRELLKLLKG